MLFLDGENYIHCKLAFILNRMAFLPHLFMKPINSVKIQLYVLTRCIRYCSLYNHIPFMKLNYLPLLQEKLFLLRKWQVILLLLHGYCLFWILICQKANLNKFLLIYGIVCSDLQCIDNSL